MEIFHVNLEDLPTKGKIFIIINILLGSVTAGIQIFLISFYKYNMPSIILTIAIIGSCSCIFIVLYNLFNVSKLVITSRNLEEAKLYNQTVNLLLDNMRCFKHDFNNIMQGIGGYVETNNMSGLKKYYSQLQKDCNRVNNLSTLNPKIINSSAIYNVIAGKYHKANDIEVQISLCVLVDLNELENHLKMYQFTRILGILIDNAIEAASECDEKMVYITFRKEENRSRFIIVIENTYFNKDIDLNRIFEKDFSTKSEKTNSGLGLWEVREFLKKNKNLNLYTSKNDNLFSQQLEIYY